jgi:hypothetical protein
MKEGDAPVDSGALISIILPVFGLSGDGFFIFGGQNSLKNRS